MPTYNKIGRNEMPSVDPERIGKMDVIYAYQDDRLNSIVFTIPLEDDTDERVAEELRSRVKHAETAGPAAIEVE